MRKFVSALYGAGCVLALCASATVAQADGWCAGKTIVVFSGGPSGGTFNTIKDKGALQAASDTGRCCRCASNWFTSSPR